MNNLKEPLWQECPVKPAFFPQSTPLKLSRPYSPSPCLGIPAAGGQWPCGSCRSSSCCWGEASEGPSLHGCSACLWLETEGPGPGGDARGCDPLYSHPIV